MLNIIIADEHQMFRTGLKSMLESDTGIRVIGEAGNGRDLVKIALEKNPDFVILDVNMPELNGIEAVRQLTAAGIKTKIIALSMYSDLGHVKNMLQAGASGFILKDCSCDELSLGISLVSDNQTYLSPQIADSIAKDYVRQLSAKKVSQENGSPVSMLSSPEREVLRLITEGRSTSGIAGKLSVNIKTVETHLQKIMSKLEIYSIAELTRFAVRKGLTSLE